MFSQFFKKTLLISFLSLTIQPGISSYYSDRGCSDSGDNVVLPLLVGSIVSVGVLGLIAALWSDTPARLLSSAKDRLRRVESHGVTAIASRHSELQNVALFFKEINECCCKSTYPSMLAFDWFIESCSQVDSALSDLYEAKLRMMKKEEKYWEKIQECDYWLRKADQMKAWILNAMDLIRKLPNYTELRMGYEHMKATEEKIRLERERLYWEKRKACAQEDAASAARDQARATRELASRTSSSSTTNIIVV